MSNNATHYNYNIEQCNWLLKNGFISIGCGVNPITKGTFIVYKVSKKYKQACKYYDEELSLTK